MNEVETAKKLNYKYIELILAMKKNRDDWSDGYVDRALYFFHIETEFDRQIFNELSTIVLEAKNIDARIFRDCDYLTNHVLTEDDRVELNKLYNESNA